MGYCSRRRWVTLDDALVLCLGLDVGLSDLLAGASLASSTALTYHPVDGAARRAGSLSD
jgi:hypothetical protein